MALKGVLFDLDGTLIHFQINYQKCRLQTIQILEEQGYPKNILSTESFVLKMLNEASSYFIQKKHYSKEKVLEIRKMVDQLIAKEEFIAAQKAEIIPDMDKVLEYLTQSNLKLGIITLNTSKNAMISLQQAGIYQYFPDPNVIIGRDRTSKIKPDPAHASSFLKYFGLNASEICIVGDHPSDIETANRLGAHSIAVVSSKHKKDEFKTPYFVKQEKPLPKLLELLKNI
ncbi:HAD family hydrolase [Candidatus Harpocratesius sp.]